MPVGADIKAPRSLIGRSGNQLRLVAMLGQGGMADVYLVLETIRVGGSSPSAADVRRLAVVKQLRTGVADDPEFVAMFLNEGRIAARLTHPNIVHTYEVGEYEGAPYLAMEYVDGVSLQALVAARSRNEPAAAGFTIRHVVRVLLDTLSALQYAHGLCDFDGTPLGLVHRDVSPHNILVSFDGQVKLADFGIAKAANSSVETRTGVVKGKLRFMAPEQAVGDSIDARADLYSVGVILWEALAGERRYAGLSNVAIQHRLTSKEPPVSPNGAARGFPPALDALVLRVLDPDPERRPATADELRRELTRIAQELGPLPSHEELGALVARCFARDRAERQRLVEAAARHLDGGVAEGMPASGDAPPASATAETILGAAARRGVVRSAVHEAPRQAPSTRASASARAVGSRRWPKVLVVGLSGVGLAAVGWAYRAPTARAPELTAVPMPSASNEPPRATPLEGGLRPPDSVSPVLEADAGNLSQAHRSDAGRAPASPPRDGRSVQPRGGASARPLASAGGVDIEGPNERN